MQLPRDMAQMDAQELRDLATSLFAQVTQQSQELKHKQLKIDQLTHRDGRAEALAVRPA
jgi:hypothetical protein